MTWLLVAFGGLVADWLRAQGAPWTGPVVPMRRSALVWGLLPLLLGIGFSVGTGPAEMEQGPRLLLVTPGLEQVRKSLLRRSDR